MLSLNKFIIKKYSLVSNTLFQILVQKIYFYIIRHNSRGGVAHRATGTFPGGLDLLIQNMAQVRLGQGSPNYGPWAGYSPRTNFKEPAAPIG